MSESRRANVPLPSLSVVSAATSLAQAGKLNRISATAGNRTVNLPPIDGLGFGTRLQIQKFDSSVNTVQVLVADGDEVGDQALALVLSRHLELVELAVINDTWQAIGGYLPSPNGTLVATNAIQTLKGKTMSGTENTFTDLPMSALGVGKVSGKDAAGNPKSYEVQGMTASQYASLAVKQAATIYVVVP